MAKIRVDLNSFGVRAFLKGDVVQDILRQVGEHVLANAGEGHELSVSGQGNRAHGRVSTTTEEALWATLRDNHLARALYR